MLKKKMRKMANKVLTKVNSLRTNKEITMTNRTIINMSRLVMIEIGNDNIY